MDSCAGCISDQSTGFEHLDIDIRLFSQPFAAENGEPNINGGRVGCRWRCGRFAKREVMSNYFHERFSIRFCHFHSSFISDSPPSLYFFFFFLGGNFFSRFDSFGQGHDSSKCETDMTKSLEPNGAVS